MACSQLTDAFLVNQLDQLIHLYDKPLKDVEKTLKKLIQADEQLQLKVERLCAIKGLGLLSVATLVAETNGFTGFDNQRQLVSYAGYDVVESQSGKRVGKTRISKKGNSRIRRIRLLPALNAVRYQEPISEALYQRVMERTGDESVCSRTEKAADSGFRPLEKPYPLRPQLSGKQAQSR